MPFRLALALRFLRRCRALLLFPSSPSRALPLSSRSISLTSALCLRRIVMGEVGAGSSTLSFVSTALRRSERSKALKLCEVTAGLPLSESSLSRLLRGKAFARERAPVSVMPLPLRKSAIRSPPLRVASASAIAAAPASPSSLFVRSRISSGVCAKALAPSASILFPSRFSSCSADIAGFQHGHQRIYFGKAVARERERAQPRRALLRERGSERFYADVRSLAHNERRAVSQVVGLVQPRCEPAVDFDVGGDAVAAGRVGGGGDDREQEDGDACS